MIDRLALGPVRAAARSGRDRLTNEAERAIDAALAGPLPEQIGRSIVEHHVLERVAAGMVDTADGNGYDSDALKDLADRVGQSAALREWVTGDEAGRLAATLTRQVVDSHAFKQALKDTLSSPEIRAALSSQTAGFADEVAATVRTRSRRADRGLEARLRRLFRQAPVDRSEYGGFASRGVGLVVDAALAELGFVALAASVALVAALAGGLRPGWLEGTLAGIAWLVAAAVYFASFWSITGQTPGMRLVGLRVVTRAGTPPSALRSVVRFVGLILAIIPLFAGFLPVLFDGRRRALQDFLSGTVVVADAATRPRPAA